MDEAKRLYRSREDRMISGVCAGIGEYFDIDPTLVRLAAVILLVVGNVATLIAYIAMAVLVPEEGTEEYVARQPAPAGPGPASVVTEPAVEPAAEPVTAPVVERPAADSGLHRGSSATVALVLILVGAVFLVAQLLPGVHWWALWPLIIVLVGLVQAITPGREGWSVHRFFDGLVTVAFGLVFLAVTTGVVGWGVWWRILGLWPVLLIALGLDLLGKSLRTSWLRALGSLAIIGALAFSVGAQAGEFRGFSFIGTSRGEAVNESARVGNVREATLRMEAGLANVTVDSGDELIAVDGRSPFGQPTLDVERSADSADIELRLGETVGVTSWPGAESRLDVSLSDSVLWDIELETGVASLSADLTSVPVRSISLRPGVADCDVTLGPVPEGVSEARGTIKSGVSSVVLRVPRDAEVRLESAGGISSTSVGGRLEQLESGVWETPGFEAAQRGRRPVWIITAETGIGSFRLDTH